MSCLDVDSEYVMICFDKSVVCVCCVYILYILLFITSAKGRR